MSSKRFDLVKEIFADSLTKEAGDSIPTYLNLNTLRKQLNDVNREIAEVYALKLKLKNNFEDTTPEDKQLAALELKRAKIKSAIKTKELTPEPQEEIKDEIGTKTKEEVFKGKSDMEKLLEDYNKQKSPMEGPTVLFKKPEQVKTKEQIQKSKKKKDDEYLSPPEESLIGGEPEVKTVIPDTTIELPELPEGKKIADLDEAELAVLEEVMSDFKRSKLTEKEVTSMLINSGISPQDVIAYIEDFKKESSESQELKDIKKRYNLGLIEYGKAKEEIYKFIENKYQINDLKLIYDIETSKLKTQLKSGEISQEEYNNKVHTAKQPLRKELQKLNKEIGKYISPEKGMEEYEGLPEDTRYKDSTVEDILESYSNRNLTKQEVYNKLINKDTFNLSPDEALEKINSTKVKEEMDTAMPFLPGEVKGNVKTFAPGESKVIKCHSCGYLNNPWRKINVDGEPTFVETKDCRSCKEPLTDKPTPGHFFANPIRTKGPYDINDRKVQKLPDGSMERTKSTFDETQKRLAKNFLDFNINVKKREDGTPILSKTGLPIPLPVAEGILAEDILKLLALPSKPKDLQKMIDKYNKSAEESGKPKIAPMRLAVDMSDPRRTQEVPILNAWNIKKLTSVPEIKERYTYAQKVLIPEAKLGKHLQRTLDLEKKDEELVAKIDKVKSTFKPYEDYQKLNGLRKKDPKELTREEIQAKLRLEAEIGAKLNNLQSSMSLLGKDLAAVRKEYSKSKEKTIKYMREIGIEFIQPKEGEKLPKDAVAKAQAVVEKSDPEVKELAETLPDEDTSEELSDEEIAMQAEFDDPTQDEPGSEYEYMDESGEELPEKTSSRFERIISLAIDCLE
jgi:hypothetical protein